MRERARASQGWMPRMVAPRPGTDHPTPRLSAATWPPIAPPAPSPTSAAAPTPKAPIPAAAPPPQPPKEGTRMQKKPKRATQPRAYPARKTPGGNVSPQFQICALLMAKGELTRAEIAGDVQVANEAALTNALFNAKGAKRIELNKNIGKYSITPAGREWANGGANLDNQRASAAPPSPAAVKRSRREPTVRAQDLSGSEQLRLGVVPAQVEPVARPSFRCAVISDGGFFMEKNGTRIDLEPDESRAMVRYLDRMAEQAA